MAEESKDTITSTLSGHRAEVAARFGVWRLAVFGSAARDELSDTSDVDILVEFEGKATFARFMDLKFYLEDVLERSVDLVTVKALHPELRPAIEAEAIDVAWLIVRQIEQAGSTNALPKMAVPGIGWLASWKDTEGIIFGTMQAAANAA